MMDWTFKSNEVVDEFDAHVREQLPWYELVTESIVYIARNYLPKEGLIYDIGASTGNMAKALEELVEERNAVLYAVEESPEMCSIFKKNHPDKFLIEMDATNLHYEKFDVAIVMLTAMFFPVARQTDFFNNLFNKLNEGGAIIVVDKSCDEDGYFATVMKRLTLYWKLKNGATPENIIKKELSLSGIQRPIKMFGGKQFFQLGEFKGWVIEK
jgi:tRNA (cmo5U34)-methyltransferase